MHDSHASGRSQCERCLAPTPSLSPSLRTICVRCATLSPSGRESAIDLAALTGARDERISLEIAGVVDESLAPPPITTRRSFAPVLWVGLGALLGALSFASGDFVLNHAEASLAAARQATTYDAVVTPPERDATEPSADVPSSNESEDSTSEVTPPEPTPVETPSVEEGLEEEVEPEPVTRPRQRSRAPAERTEPVAPTPAERPPAPVALTPLPSRASVRGAFARVRGGIERCGEVEHIGSVVTARVTFDGTTGRVAHAQITDATVPPEVRSCVARGAREVRVEPFAREQFIVLYPFRL